MFGCWASSKTCWSCWNSVETGTETWEPRPGGEFMMSWLFKYSVELRPRVSFGAKDFTEELASSWWEEISLIESSGALFIGEK